jgi:FAD/FMN-containing dehydrogenase/Fe-S oxidoreductase
MSSPVADLLERNVDCEVRCDDLTRQLYATDASIHQIEPVAVAFPRTAQQAAAVIRAANDAGIPVTPRGAGTGLAGGAIGDGLIVDLARHTLRIGDLDLEKRSVRVGAGVVLDQLNEFLRPHGLCFGPDVATSSRATLGGMIANNSSGARAPVYGTTIDHVAGLEVVLADGTIAVVGAGRDGLPRHREAVDALVAGHAGLIRERFPDTLVKRWPAYALDDCLRSPGDLSKIITGSEGTLAGIVSAELQLVPMPKRKGLGLCFFATVEDAMQATVAILDLKPAAIEHVDQVLFDQTKGQLEFHAARDLLELDAKPCGAFLIVEFYDDVNDRLEALSKRRLGLRFKATTDPDGMLEVWALRKRGLSLLSGCKGPAKPIAGVEDVAVRPEKLPEYVAAVRSLAEPLGLEMSYYGHAASGLLHVRPVVDLHRADSIAKYRQLAERISTVTREFKGSFTGEHGVGISRAEFMAEHLGADLLEVMRRIKAVFDANGLMNPGKVFPDGGRRIDGNLRWGAGYAIPTPFEPVLAFASKDESFVANLEQCNGCGDCRKEPPAMCPTFPVTGDEIMSTRGRANTIRAVLDGRIVDAKGPLCSEALDAALSNCLSCKACKKECPSNVDLALLKAELLYARQRKHGVRLLERFVSRFDLIGKLGCMAPGLANATLRMPLARAVMEKTIGLAARRPLPQYARQRFDRWVAKHNGRRRGPRGRVILWDDCSVRYHEPRVGIAAVKVLEAAGYEVGLPGGARCCGRPAFSVGRLDVARRFGLRNVALFAAQRETMPIIFLEPSCYSMFAGDYRELKIPDADRVAERCILFEQFLHDLLERDPGALAFTGPPAPIAIHGHCHAKALTDVRVMPELAARVPNAGVTWLDTGCCGMAGSFGALRTKYELSLAVAKPLVEKINALAPGTRLVASGTSCRQQIHHLTPAKPLHMAELLAQTLPGFSRD